MYKVLEEWRLGTSFPEVKLGRQAAERKFVYSPTSTCSFEGVACQKILHTTQLTSTLFATMRNTHNMLVAVSVVMVAWVALGAHTTTATPLAKVMPWYVWLGTVAAACFTHKQPCFVTGCVWNGAEAMHLLLRQG